MVQELKKQIINAFQFRHACKEFDLKKKIPEEDFQFLLETARLSPSSFGLEPWKIVVVQNKQLRRKLKEVSWGAVTKLPSASHFIVFIARTKRDLLYDSNYVRYIHRHIKKNTPELIEKRVSIIKNFQESDFKLLECERSLFDWACRQAYIALGNMMTAAAQIGIDSCPIEGFDHDKTLQIFQEEGIIKGNEFGIACMVAFGYRIKEQPQKNRRTMEEIVCWK